MEQKIENMTDKQISKTIGRKTMENRFEKLIDPVSYIFFKKEFLVHLEDYHKLRYLYEYSPQLSRMAATSIYQNGALLMKEGEISITFNDVVGDDIVFNDFSIDLITYRMFLEMGYLEVRDISSVDEFNAIVDSIYRE